MPLARILQRIYLTGCSYMSMKEDFKKFAMRGNVMDMAVGVIIGGAFGKIVSSLVNDVVMPPLGMALGKMDFSNLFISLNGKEYATLEAAKKAGAPVLAYGSFINSVLDFLILAFVIFYNDSPNQQAYSGTGTCTGTASVPLLQIRDCRRRSPLPALHISFGITVYTFG